MTTSAKRLRKSRDKKLYGVCGGIAEYLGVDPTLVRLAWVLVTILLALLGGILIYFIFALVMPEPSEA